MTTTDWIRENYAEHGRDFVINGRELCRDVTNHNYSEPNWNRQVRRIIRELEGLGTEPDESWQVKSIDDALSYHDIEESAYDIKKLTVNTWGGASSPSQQVKLELKPKEDQFNFEEFKQAFLEATSKVKFKFQPRHKDVGNLTAELSLPDMHFGKLIYGEATGSEDYGPEQAQQLYLDAVHSLTVGTEATNFILPIGEDFFNCDTFTKTTTNGTPMENVDPRQMYHIGLATAFSAIEYLAELGNVHVPIVPGNHDRLLSYAAGLAIEQRFRNDDRVTIDSGPQKSKAYGRGSWGVVFTHAEKNKPQDLAWIFPEKFPELWNGSQFREVHCGHLHNNKLTDEIQGVRLILLPSLIPYDHWHDENNYRSLREAQMHLWHDKKGKISMRYYHPGT